MRYDVIVVGAGPAGCAAAYDLAAAGVRVLLLDHRRFPRTKACAGGLTIKTLRRLRYPVTPVVRQVCTELVVGRRLEESVTLRGPHPVCAMTVRSELDEYCLARTLERGAELRLVSRIHAVIDGVDGVRLETGDGELRAGYLVGADGANGVVRRLVFGRDGLRKGFAIEARVRMASPPPMRFDFGVVRGGYGWLFPKGDHVNLGLYTGDPEVRPGRAELADYARRRLGAVEAEEVVGHAIGLGGWEGPLAGRRVVLAGDAAGLVDPLLGEGIYKAVVSGQAAAAAILHDRRNPGRLAAAYSRELRPELDDLRTAARDAARFYGNVDRGYRLLALSPVRSAILRGYARGMTYSGTKRSIVFLPFLPVPAVPLAG